jgi:hypothetical protein
MAKRNSLVKEMWMFMLANKAYWLVPLIGMLLLLAALVFLGGTSAAPFIYTLF